MPAFLDEAAITGVASKAPTGAPALPKGAQFLAEAAITGVDAIDRSVQESQSFGGKAKAVASDVAKYTAGTLGTAADMILGSPAMVGNYLAHVAGRVGAQIADPSISQKTAAGAGQAYAEELIPEWAYAPLSTAVEKLSPGALHYLNNSPLGKIMGLASKGIEVTADLAEKHTGLPADDLKAGINGLMGAAGVKGGKVAAEALVRKIEAAAKKAKVEEASAPATQPDTSVPYDTTPAKPDAAARRAELDKQIKEEQKARSAVAEKIKAAAKYQKLAEKLEDGDPLKATLQERADLAAQEAADAQAELKARATPPKSDVAERVGGTTYSPGHELAAEIKDIAAKPGHLRTPEEMIQLRGALQELRKKQGGKIDPDLAAWIATGGLTALGGTLLYQLYSKYRDSQDRMTPEERKADDDAKKDLLKDFEREQMEQNPRPNPPENWRNPNEKPIYTAEVDLTPAMATGLLMAGAVKGKGGMWHPEAVTRLSTPLRNRLTNMGVPGDAPFSEGVKATEATNAWSDRAIRNYLNRHAGTEGDPLKDAEIPYMGGTEKWGKVVDDAIIANKNGMSKVPALPHVPVGEPVYNVRGPRAQGPRGEFSPVQTLSNYLSHVGDFLRQNVAPEKLQQYDLVRAVKETAANDARVAKEMERAAAASMKDMPVYKDYDDGMKWVELKLPEGPETPEWNVQMTAPEHYTGRARVHEESGNLEDSYVAMGPDGKPIANSYTGDLATGPTPAHARLAGQLAQEGNQMGHCVGGYCSDVASGQTRILSLRDAKGRSHVTVEVETRSLGREADIMNGEEAAAPEPDAILQIKGKQNRAPDARYLPYVQDLVKGGKWGEVGDLGNTGLIRWKGKHYTKEELNALPDPELDAYASRNVLPGQRGSADPKLLASIAAVGGAAASGAYINEDHPFKGAAYGAGIGVLLASARPRAWVEAIKRAQVTGPVVRIEDATRQRAYAEKVAARATYKMTQEIEKAVPDQARREALYLALENERPVALTPNEKAVAGKVRDYYNALGRLAKDAGVVREVIDDYATRIYGANRGLFKGKRVGGGTSLDSPFGKPRGFKTREEAEAAGFKPVTTDISQVLQIYSDSINKAIENRKFIETLKASALPDNTKLLAKEGKAPEGYVFIDHPQLRGLRVHPDVAPDLRFIFDAKNPGAILSALDTINSTQKRMGVSLSLFHAAALEHAMLGATSILKSPFRGARILGQSFAPAIFGENLTLKMVREGGAGDMIDRAQKAGLEFSFERSKPAIMEEQFGLYKALDATTKFLDATVPGAGKYTTGAFAALNHAFDRAMWGRFHAAMKLETFADKAAELERNNARAIEAGKQGKPKEETDRMAASFTNDTFGGLNWQQLMQEFTSRWGREVASAAFSPSGRFGMRMVMFAPDWTISTTRAFVKGFGQRGVAAGAGAVAGMQIDPDEKVIGGLLGAAVGYAGGRAINAQKAGGTGVSGLLHPRELADLHRQYVLRSALIYTGIVDAINYQMSGHHFWDNKDPTRLDRGDGTTQQVSKHFMEPIHWLLTPRQQAMNKLSFIVKEPLAQMQDVEYLSAGGAPRMGKTPKKQDISLGTRVEHVAKQFLPISAQGMDSDHPERALASFLGAPIYGKTKAEREALKLELKRKRLQKQR